MPKHSTEFLWTTKRIARDLRRDAMQDKVLPLHKKLKQVLGATICAWKGDPQDLEDAAQAAKKWIAADRMIYTEAHGSTAIGSTLIAAKALFLEEFLAQQAYAAESGALTFSSPAKTPEELFLSLWDKVAPASEGWSNEFIQRALGSLSTWGEEEESLYIMQ